MNKLAVFLILLSLGLFAVGCGSPQGPAPDVKIEEGPMAPDPTADGGGGGGGGGGDAGPMDVGPMGDAGPTP